MTTVLAALVLMTFQCKVIGDNEGLRPFIVTCKCRVGDKVHWTQKATIKEFSNIELIVSTHVNEFLNDCKKARDHA